MQAKLQGNGTRHFKFPTSTSLQSTGTSRLKAKRSDMFTLVLCRNRPQICDGKCLSLQGPLVKLLASVWCLGIYNANLSQQSPPYIRSSTRTGHAQAPGATWKFSLVLPVLLWPARRRKIPLCCQNNIFPSTITLGKKQPNKSRLANQGKNRNQSCAIWCNNGSKLYGSRKKHLDCNLALKRQIKSKVLKTQCHLITL